MKFTEAEKQTLRTALYSYVCAMRQDALRLDALDLPGLAEKAREFAERASKLNERMYSE